MYAVVETYCNLRKADDYGIKSTQPLKVKKRNTKVGVKLWNVQFALSFGVTVN
jgi:hypothetical protein